MTARTSIAILTGGGDVPGLNAVIKSVVYRATEMGRNVIGIRKGWKGLTHMNPAEKFRRDLRSRVDARKYPDDRPHRRHGVAHIADQSTSRRDQQSS